MLHYFTFILRKYYEFAYYTYYHIIFITKIYFKIAFIKTILDNYINL